VLRLINTGVQIHVGEIGIFGMQLVDKFEIVSMCALVDLTLEGLCNSRHCDQPDWFMG
jgi:hypothetical protein